LQHGRVVSIVLTSSTCKASVLLVRQPSPIGIDAQAQASDGSQMRRWRFPASTLGEAELLDGCLQTLGPDPVFEAALDA
jgi:hypothetical protein